MKYTLRDATIKFQSYHDEVPSVDYQRVSFNAEQLPEIKEWQPGQEYLIVLKVRQKDFRVPDKDDSDDQSKYHASFEILEVGGVENGSKEIKKKVKEKLNLK